MRRKNKNKMTMKNTKTMSKIKQTTMMNEKMVMKRWIRPRLSQKEQDCSTEWKIWSPTAKAVVTVEAKVDAGAEAVVEEDEDEATKRAMVVEEEAV